MENYEMEKNKFFLDKYFQLIIERDKTIIFVVQLIIALLVIVNFNGKIISNLNVIKTLITVLLFLTPIMIVDYLLRLNDGLNTLAKVLGDKSSDKKKWLKKLIDGSNYLYALIIIVIIDIIIGLIISNLTISLSVYLVQTIIVAVLIFAKRLSKTL
jgi:hypothetical protein